MITTMACAPQGNISMFGVGDVSKFYYSSIPKKENFKSCCNFLKFNNSSNQNILET